MFTDFTTLVEQMDDPIRRMVARHSWNRSTRDDLLQVARLTFWTIWKDQANKVGPGFYMNAARNAVIDEQRRLQVQVGGFEKDHHNPRHLEVTECDFINGTRKGEGDDERTYDERVGTDTFGHDTDEYHRADLRIDIELLIRDRLPSVPVQYQEDVLILLEGIYEGYVPQHIADQNGWSAYYVNKIVGLMKNHIGGREHKPHTWSEEVRDEVKDLLAKGFSQRQIAHRIGCSRCTVQRIMKES